MRTAPQARAPPAFSTAEAEGSVEASYRLNSAGSYDLEHSGCFMNEESSLPVFGQQTPGAQWLALSR